MIDEINEMLHPETLPLYRFDRRAHYEGSIDKTGKNSDWDWCLYQDRKGEYVLFEQYGPGCIYNFVQHRYITSEEPVFRFYFDDDIEPRFELRPIDFGDKYPFVSPLADKFIGPDRPDVGHIRVVRSFVPMPFTSYCKVTSSLKLEGSGEGQGGWGHVVYHTYTGDTPCQSFNPVDERYRKLAQLWRTAGAAPLNGDTASEDAFALAAGESRTIFHKKGAGLLTAIRLRTDRFRKADLLNLYITIRWEEESVPAVELPFGAFFCNELGDHKIGYLYAGMDAQGGYENFFPMPFKDCAEVSVQNKGTEVCRFLYSAVSCTDVYNELYCSGSFGHFRTSPYYPKTHTPGADSVIARLSPVHGHVVGSVITGYGIEDGARADCEGDARIHFDGLRTPCIESDGSESYSCYGWGFICPPQCNPASGYDGKDIALHVDWSMTRLLPGEVYPFNEKLHFGIESFLFNDGDMFHSGAVFYYGENGSLMEKIAEYATDEETLTARFEGDDDDIDVTLQGDRGKEIRLFLNVNTPDELLLRRVSDQHQRGQYAKVYLNGELLPLPWYCPDGNPCLRWLEDEYRIPGKLLLPNDVNEVRIVPCEFEGIDSFNQFGVCVYAVQYGSSRG